MEGKFAFLGCKVPTEPIPKNYSPRAMSGRFKRGLDLRDAEVVARNRN